MGTGAHGRRRHTEASRPRGTQNRSPASWGSVWLVQLSEASDAYLSQLRSRGRMKVIDLMVAPGRVHARVVDRRGEVRPADFEVRQLSRSELDDMVDAIGSSAGTLAALLDGNVPSRLIDAAEEIEIGLFPSPSDLRMSCSCDEWRDPCPHAAAVLRALAESMDRDPFTMLELRGLPRAELLADIRRRRDPTQPGRSDIPPTDPWESWDADRATPVPHTAGALPAPDVDIDPDSEPAVLGTDDFSGLDPASIESIQRGWTTAITRARGLLR